jgi:hypothetical protein
LRRSTLLTIIALCAVSGGATAQVMPSRLLPPLPTSVRAPEPGTWVRYSLFYKRTRQLLQIRMALLGREGDASWFEVSITDDQRRTMVYKTLLKGPLHAPTRIVRALVQPPGQRALLLPSSVGDQPLPRFHRSPGKRGKRVARAVKVKVPAGTFTAAHYRKGSGKQATEIWMTSRLKGWPVVKVVSPALVMELSAHGGNARSQIRGKPIKLDKQLLKQLGFAR